MFLLLNLRFYLVKSKYFRLSRNWEILEVINSSISKCTLFVHLSDIGSNKSNTFNYPSTTQRDWRLAIMPKPHVPHEANDLALWTANIPEISHACSYRKIKSLGKNGIWIRTGMVKGKSLNHYSTLAQPKPQLLKYTCLLTCFECEGITAFSSGAILLHTTCVVLVLWSYHD